MSSSEKVALIFKLINWCPSETINLIKEVLIGKEEDEEHSEEDEEGEEDEENEEDEKEDRYDEEFNDYYEQGANYIIIWE